MTADERCQTGTGLEPASQDRLEILPGNHTFLGLLMAVNQCFCSANCEESNGGTGEAVVNV